MLTPAGNQPGIPPDAAAVRSAAAATLLALLSGGDEVSGRVVGNVGENMWAITVRGRTLVAESAVPLTPDTVVKLALQTMSDGEVRVRLAQSRPPSGTDTTGTHKAESATTVQSPMVTAAFARLASLGLPASPAALLVLAAFEEAGAPLEPERLRSAIVQVAATAKPEAPAVSGDRPRPDSPPLAGGRPPPSVSGLPMSPLVAIDHAAAPQRAVSAPVQPAPGARPDVSTRPSVTMTSGMVPKPAGSVSVPMESPPPLASAPIIRLAQPAVVATAVAASQVPAQAALPVQGVATAITTSPRAVGADSSAPVPIVPGRPLVATITPVAPLAPPARLPPGDVSPVGLSVRSSSPSAVVIAVDEMVTADPQRAVVPARVPGSLLVAPAVVVNALPHPTGTGPRLETVDAARASVLPPRASAAPSALFFSAFSAVPAALVQVVDQEVSEPVSAQRVAVAHARLAAADLPATPALVRLALSAQGPGLPQVAAALQGIPTALSRLLPTLSPAQAALVTAAAAQIPSVADLADGPPAAERALAQVGLRPAAEPEQAGVSTPTPTLSAERPLLRALAELAVALREAEATTGPSEPRSAVGEAVTRTVREAMAEQVFKPKDLADYDRVVPLPLAADGRPLPARVAVASRHGANGERATWVRIDAELSHLGAVSVRLSGGAGGPIAITLVAEPGPAQELIAGLPDLVADLTQRGLIAAVRVATPDEVVHG